MKVKESPIGSNSDGNRFIDSINRKFGLYKQPWCAMYVSEMIKDNVNFPKLRSALALNFAVKNYRHSMYEVAMNKYVVKVGDLLVFNYGLGKGHVCIVIEVNKDNNEFTIIGGNQSDKVSILKYTLTQLITKKGYCFVDVSNKYKSIEIPKTIKKEIFKDSLVLKGTYYHSSFGGRRMSNGKVFDNNKFTAAHKTLKLGTVCKVINPINNKSVYVVITDRCLNHGIIDLTQRAAKQIDIHNTKVKVLIR